MLPQPVTLLFHSLFSLRGTSLSLKYLIMHEKKLLLSSCFISILAFAHIHLSLPASGVVYAEVRRPCRFMILVNPHSGRGQALQLFTGHVQGMLTEAAVPYTLIITGQ